MIKTLDKTDAQGNSVFADTVQSNNAPAIPKGSEDNPLNIAKIRYSTYLESLLPYMWVRIPLLRNVRYIVGVDKNVPITCYTNRGLSVQLFTATGLCVINDNAVGSVINILPQHTMLYFLYIETSSCTMYISKDTIC